MGEIDELEAELTEKTEKLCLYELLIEDIIETVENRGDSSVADWIKDRFEEIR